jgi:hypothetical protein
MKTLFVALCLFLFSVSPGYADGGNWVVKKDEAGVQVQQQQSGSPHETTKGVVEVEATLDALAALLKDISACPRWVHDCKEGRLVETISPAERITYTVIHLPFPLQDRDMYIDSVIRYQRKSNTIVITLTGKENQDATQPGRTRVLALQGSWVFQQTSPGHVRVSYQIQANPQAPFNGPTNDHMVESVFHTLQNLRDVVKDAQYRDAKFSEAEIRAIEVK